MFFGDCSDTVAVMVLIPQTKIRHVTTHGLLYGS